MKRLIRAKWYDMFLPVGKQIKSQLESRYPDCKWEVEAYDKLNFTCSLSGEFNYQYRDMAINIQIGMQINDVNKFGNDWIQYNDGINMTGTISKTINGETTIVYDEKQTVNGFTDAYGFIDKCFSTPIQY